MDPGINGLALGVSGAAGILLEWNIVGKVVPMVLMVCSATVWFSFTLQRLWRWHMIQIDFQKPQTISPWGAWQMTFLFCWIRLVAPTSGRTLNSFGPWLGALLQMIIMILFLRLCFKQNIWPEPLYNPPTINISVTAIAAITIPTTPTIYLAYFSFGLALVLTLLFFPIQVYRIFTLRNIANNASVAMLQAPWSIDALSWEFMRRAQSPNLVFDKQENTLTYILFVFSTIGLWLTVLAVWKKRHSVLKSAIDITWAAFTFPSCSSAITALQFSQRTSSSVVRFYARALAVIVLLLVFTVIICNITHFFFIVYAPPLKLPLDPPHIVTAPNEHQHELVIIQWSTPLKKNRKQIHDAPNDAHVSSLPSSNEDVVLIYDTMPPLSPAVEEELKFQGKERGTEED
mmetsp:Transcript_11689/g.17469  ORF Transcript_11689/g.17469 Transcript_11689/m.17469 type:complete len:401 (-) Transcript_11689:283-1485(-)